MARPVSASIGRNLQVAWLLGLAATASSSAPPSPSFPEKHFVWQVTNVAAPFYLVGSIHNLRARDYPLPKVYLEALASSERVLFEFSPRRRDALTRKFLEIAKYPGGQDIESEVHPATIGLLKKSAWRFRTSYEQLRHYRPWAIALRLLSEQGPIGPSSGQSMDTYLTARAQRAGKEVGGLETVDEHVAFWREMLERDGENLLLYALTRKKSVSLLFDKTRAAWKSGDVAALSATNATLRQANPGIAQKLLDRRNARWVTRIEAEMKTGKPTAIVAGAGHFSGPGSVIALLQERGYRIKQL